MLTTKQVDWYVAQYVRTPDDLHDPRVSPLLEDLYGAPPTHLTIGGYDVLRDECLAYVDKLKESGVNTTLQLVEGHIHAFANSAGVSPSATPALQQSIKALEEGMKRAAEAKRQ
jgi:acetyl esterase